MDYEFISIDNYQILVYNHRGFMSLADVIKLLKCEYDKIKNDLENRANNENNTDVEHISYNDEPYYSLDIIVLNAFDYDYKAAFKLYESALKKKIVFTDFVKNTMTTEKASFEKLSAIVRNNKNLIKTFYKYEDTVKEDNYYGNPGYITLESLQILIGLIKESYDFDDNFGVIKDYSTLLDILYFTNSAFSDDDSKEIEFGDEDDISYAVKTMYNIIKMKPFVSGNEIIATFIAYYYLEQSSLIEDEGTKITTCEDIILASGLIINSTDDNVVNTLKKAKSLLAKHYALSNSQTMNKLKPIIDTSKEGIMNYIISSIEDFYGYQGYYEYYKGKSCVYKIHYHGSYNGISLNKAKTFVSDKTLYFKGTLYCFSEAPTDLIDRETFLKDIVEEIEYRSYNDVIIPFLNKIKNKVKSYFDLDSISIKFDFETKTKFDENYEW